jgi:hypothetical protein
MSDKRAHRIHSIPADTGAIELAENGLETRTQLDELYKSGQLRILASGLEEKPHATLRLVDPNLDQTRAGNIAVLVAKGVCPSQARHQLSIVIQKLGKHILGGDILLIIVGDALKSSDVPNRMQGRPADFPDALRYRIGDSEYLLTLFVQKKVIVPKMRA